MQQARAFWISKPGAGELRNELLPAPAADEVRIRTLYSAISRGSESLVFKGCVPSSQYRIMRAPFQAGEFPAPVKYGYSSVGIVEHGPAELCQRKIFCLYPHQSAYVVPADAVLPIPDNIPAERAILAANMETALNGLWDAAPLAGDRIAVIGAGTIGCLLAYLLAQIPGCDVCLIDIAPARQNIADRLGVKFVLAQHAPDNCDLVIHASGAADGLRTALTLAGFEAHIIELSWYGAGEVSLALGEAFHSKRLRIQASQVSTIANRQRGRWTHKRRLEKVFELLGDERLDCLINEQSHFTELPATMARLAAKPGHALCHKVIYD